MLSRLIHGARISLVVGFAADLHRAWWSARAIGIVSGYVGGMFDQVMMGLLDVLLVLPDAAARPDDRGHAGARAWRT